MATRKWLIGAVLFLLTVAAFNRVMLGEFLHWDDDVNIYANPHLGNLSLTQLKWAFTDFSYAWRYQPLSWLTWSAIHTVAGFNPFFYHLVVLFFHAGNAVLVFLLIDQLLGAAAGAQPANSNRLQLTCAATGAALWALHPLRVETVAWAVELLFTQSTFFFLLSLLAYVRKRQSEMARQQDGFCRAAWVWFSVSLLSYPLALGGPIVFIMLDFYPFRRLTVEWRKWIHAPARNVWIEKLPFLFVALLAATANLLARSSATGSFPKPPTLDEFGLSDRLMQAFYIWAHFLWKPWLPTELSPVYTTLVWFDPLSPKFLASAGLVMALTLLLIQTARKWPMGLTLWICYLTLMIPVLGLTEHPHYPSDRYSYLPGILWSVLLAAGLLKLARWPGIFRAAMVILVALIAALAAASTRQVRIWRDNISFFKHILSYLGDNPYRAEIHWRLGLAYAGQHRLDEAVEQYRLTLALIPSTRTHYLLARALDKQGKFTESLPHYREVLRTQPAYQNALWLQAIGQTQEALIHYRQLLVAAPDLWPLLNDVAWLLATDPDPTNRSAAEAVSLAERACELTRYRVPLLVGTLAAAYAEAGRFSEAIEMAQLAKSLAEAAGDHALVQLNQTALETYKAGRPYRQNKGEAAQIP